MSLNFIWKPSKNSFLFREIVFIYIVLAIQFCIVFFYIKLEDDLVSLFLTQILIHVFSAFLFVYFTLLNKQRSYIRRCRWSLSNLHLWWPHLVLKRPQFYWLTLPISKKNVESSDSAAPAPTPSGFPTHPWPHQLGAVGPQTYVIRPLRPLLRPIRPPFRPIKPLIRTIRRTRPSIILIRTIRQIRPLIKLIRPKIRPIRTPIRQIKPPIWPIRPPIRPIRPPIRPIRTSFRPPIRAIYHRWDQ